MGDVLDRIGSQVTHDRTPDQQTKWNQTSREYAEFDAAYRHRGFSQ
jgi:hypothetical protein